MEDNYCKECECNPCRCSEYEYENNKPFNCHHCGKKLDWYEYCDCLDD